MGGKPQQVDSAGAAQANAGAAAANAQSMKISQQNNDKANQMTGNLFGEDGKSGAVGGFLDPSKLNVDHPTGVYGLQYGKAIEANANAYKNSRGALARHMADQGLAEGSGIGAHESAAMDRGEADSAGNLFTDYAGKSYADALGNFWQAADMTNQAATAARGVAVQGSGQAGQTYANIYGTAGAQAKPSGLAGSLIGAGGSIAGGALACPAADSEIMLSDGTTKKVQDLDKGDSIMQFGGGAYVLEEMPTSTGRECVSITTRSGKAGVVSVEHTFMLDGGGYVYSAHSDTEMILTDSGRSAVRDVTAVGRKVVFHIPVKGNHTYCSDGLWSLA